MQVCLLVALVSLTALLELLQLLLLCPSEVLDIACPIDKLWKLLLDGSDSSNLVTNLGGNVLSLVDELSFTLNVLDFVEADHERTLHLVGARLYGAVDEFEVEILHWSIKTQLTAQAKKAWLTLQTRKSLPFPVSSAIATCLIFPKCSKFELSLQSEPPSLFYKYFPDNS